MMSSSTSSLPVSSAWARTALATLTLFLMAGVSFAAAPQVFRSSPFPNYYVGQTASLTITTSPVQANAPIYQFRYKDGQPNGDQPTLVGHTDSTGRYWTSVTVIEEWIGSYTDERFAVGSPTGPQSPPLSFTVSPALSYPPTVTRPAPFPNYEVGQTGTLMISTTPPQRYSPIYRFRYKDGAPEGPQPTLAGYTDAAGRYSITVPVVPEIVGVYSNEQYAVGSVSGPRSAPLDFTITDPDAGVLGVFLLSDCDSCDAAQREARAIENVTVIGETGEYHVVLYDGVAGAHEEFMITRDYEPALNQWLTFISHRGVPDMALTDAVDSYVDIVQTFRQNLQPFVIDDGDSGGDGSGKREKKAAAGLNDHGAVEDGVNVHGGEKAISGQNPQDFDPLSEFETLDLDALGVVGSISGIGEMNSVFLENLSQRLIDLGYVPEDVLAGIEEIGRSAASSSSVASTEGSSMGGTVNIGGQIGVGELAKAELRASGSISSTESITETEGESISSNYRVHSSVKVRIRVDNPTSLEDGHMIVRYDGERQRFVLEAATGPGGSRLPFDELGNIDTSLISNPIIADPADVDWWLTFAWGIGLNLGECHVTVNFRCLMTVIF